MSVAASIRPLFGQGSATIADEQVRQESLAVSAGLRRQDAGLLDELIVRYQHRLLRYLLYLTGNRELSEDLFQEVWMRVLVRGAQFNGQARFDTWLFTIARNLVPERPGRRYERKTKRPGGRYKTRKPGQTARLTPLTKIVFWLLPTPCLT